MPDSSKSAAECYASVVADAAIYHARRSSHNVILEQWRDRVIAEMQAECDAEELRRAERIKMLKHAFDIFVIVATIEAVAMLIWIAT